MSGIGEHTERRRIKHGMAVLFSAVALAFGLAWFSPAQMPPLVVFPGGGGGGGGGGGSDSFTSTLDLVIDWYSENNATSMDHKITNGSYIALIHHDTNATNGFLSPTNALHTVTAGKVAVVVYVQANAGVIADPSFRGMRLRNTTDSVDVVSQGANYNNSASGGLPRVAADTAELPSVVAGKAVELQTYNSSAASRARGGYIILREVDAP